MLILVVHRVIHRLWGYILTELDTLQAINAYLDELHEWVKSIKVKHDL